MTMISHRVFRMVAMVLLAVVPTVLQPARLGIAQARSITPYSAPSGLTPLPGAPHRDYPHPELRPPLHPAGLGASAAVHSTSMAGPPLAHIRRRHSPRRRLTPLVDLNCPTSWSCADIGAPPTAGTESLSSGTWNVTGSGSLGGTTDSFHYVYQDLGTVSSATASTQVNSFSGGGQSTAGVMLRESTDPGARFYWVGVGPDGSITVQYRRYPGFGVSQVTSVGPSSLPRSIEIVRSGFQFSAAVWNGSSWQAVANSTEVLGMGDTLAGMAVKSTVSFISTSVAGSGTPVTGCFSGWQCLDLGSPQVSGDQHSITGSSWEMDGAGTGLTGYWTPNDQLRYVYQSRGTDSNATVSAHVTQMVFAGSNTPYTQAGVMLRQSSDPLAPFYAVSVTSGGSIRIQYRRVQGNVSSNAQGLSGSVPSYLQIVRAGFLFTAYTSTDGSHWTAVAGSTIGITMATSLVGIFTLGGAGGDGTTLANTTFDQVSVTSGGDPIGSCPAPWTCANVGNDTQGGQSSVDGTNWAINAASTGFTRTWDSGDSFRYVSQPAGGTGSLIAHLTYFEGNSNPYGTAGIMLRAGAGNNDPFYFLAVQSVAASNAPNNQAVNLVVSGRGPNNSPPAASGTIGNINNGNPAYPIYLEVAWSGSQISFYYSWDATTWVEIASGPLPFTPQVGGMATIGGPAPTNTLGTFVFDSVKFNPDGAGPVNLVSLNSPSMAPPSCPCHQSDPIDTAGGFFWHTFGDLAVPGRGLPLALTRTYDSRLASQDSPFGFGWTAAYNQYLTTDTSGDIFVHEETGSVITFSPTGSGYQAAPFIMASLASNGDGTLTLTRYGSRDSSTFAAPSPSAAGQLLREADRNGYTTSLTYAGGRLSAVTDPEGQSLTFAYNSAGRVASVTDPANHTVAYGYDGTGNLTSVSDVLQGISAFSYDSTHLLLTMRDQRGFVVANQYDASNRVIQQTADPTGLNRVTRLSYSPGSLGTEVTTTTDPDGHVATYTYSFNVLSTETDGAGTGQAATRSMIHDQTLHVIRLTDPNNHVWTSTHDSHGNTLSTTDPNSHTTTKSYDALDDLTSSTDANGIATTLTYDSHGNLLSVSRPLTASNQTATTSLTYGDFAHPGDVTRVTDPNNHSSSYLYDVNGDVTSVTDPAGDTATYAYDNVGDLIAQVSPRGNVPPTNPRLFTSTATYDAAGEVQSTTDPLGHLTQYSYDAAGNLLQVGDANSHSTTYSYNLAGEPTGVTAADGSGQRSVYDADGAPLSQSTLSTTGTALRTLGYSYDALGREATSTDLNGRVTTYGYDAASNLTAMVDAMGRTTTYSYDPANQLTGIAYHDSGTPDVALSYTPTGRRATMLDGTGTTTYTYDSLNRLTKGVNGAGAEVDYGYDLASNLTALSYPGLNGGAAVTATRRYDAANRLTDVVDWLGNDTAFAYDANGNLSTETFPHATNGAGVGFSYTNADRLTRVTAARSSGPSPFRWSFGYGRDALGQVSAATDRLPGIRHSYGYDALNRLTGDTRSNRAVTSWSYDGAGNLQTSADTATGITQSYCYDTGDNQLLSLRSGSCSGAQGQSFSYNANGDRLSSTNLATNSTIGAMAYNQADELTGYTQGQSSASYGYDGDGLRSSKTVNGARTPFSWDLVEGMPLLLQDGTTRYLTGPDGLPIEQVSSSGQVAYYLQDQLGSTRGLLDSAGNIVGTSTFGVYGNQTGQSGTVTTPFGYAGQYTDSESGYQYLRARYYDPATSQFLTVDPLVDQTGQPYGYAAGNPLNAADPSGLDCGILGVGCLASGAAHVGGAAGRHALIWGFATTGDWIGQTHDNLTSGNPLLILLSTADVYTTVFTLGDAAGIKIGARLLWDGLVNSGRDACVETELHHTVPREILQRYLPMDVARDPAVRGRAGAPNRWAIPKDLHRQIHQGPGGGEYNQAWINALDNLQRDPTSEDVLRIRDDLAQRFGFWRFRP